MTNDRIADALPLTRGRPPRNGSTRLRILVVDDHTLLRESLSKAIRSEPGLEDVFIKMMDYAPDNFDA